MIDFTENELEDYTVELLELQGYELLDNLNNSKVHRSSSAEVILEDVFKESLQRINQKLSENQVDEVLHIIKYLDGDLVTKNQLFHKYMTKNIYVSDKVDRDRKISVKLLDFENISNNTFQIARQMTFKSNFEKRPDLIIYINGLPLSVIELKNPNNSNTDIESAYNQLKVYQQLIKNLFDYNVVNIISDKIFVGVGSITSNFERYSPYRITDDPIENQLENLINHFFDKSNFLYYIKNFITFNGTGGERRITKIVASYQQVRAVKSALASIKNNMLKTFTKKAGIVWHGAGSGKSYSMAFLASLVQKDVQLKHPTILVITDRIALDNQLYKTFLSSHNLYNTNVIKMDKSEDIHAKLHQIKIGGIFFSTLQKFTYQNPEEKKTFEDVLSTRNNILIIVDEAHRSQGVDPKSATENLKSAFPNATFIGFTATPIFKENYTRNIFGDVIDTYTMKDAVLDKTAVPLKYENRYINIELDEEKLAELDQEIEEKYADFTKSEKARIKKEYLYGADDRVKTLAEDVVTHFHNRKETYPFSKAMIVAYSRNVALKIYNEIIKQNPSFHNDDISKGAIKIVVSSSNKDSEELVAHHKSESDKKTIIKRINDEEDALDFIIVCDMWLTGFDAPLLNTMYFDKKIKMHSLIQAISRANRVYDNKDAGLIVDYVGLYDSLQTAVAEYSNKDKENFCNDISDKELSNFFNILKNVEDIIYDKKQNFKALIHNAILNNNYNAFSQTQIDVTNFLLNKDDDNVKFNFIKKVNNLQKAYALCATIDEVIEKKQYVGFFISVKELIIKNTNVKNDNNGRLSFNDLNNKIAQVINASIKSVGVMDLLQLSDVGMTQIDIYSDVFLEAIKNHKQPKTALEVLKKLLMDEVKNLHKTNHTLSKTLLEEMKDILNKYHGDSFHTVALINELLELSKDIMKNKNKQQELNITEEEFALYSALADNQQAKTVLGDKTLLEIVKVLVFRINKDVNIQWLNKGNIKAQLRIKIRRILQEFGYPPDMEKLAVENVINQVEQNAINKF